MFITNRPPRITAVKKDPAVVAEFEKEVEGIIASFGVQDQALLDIVSGVAMPSALLPTKMLAYMKTVEEQKEDVPHDMESHVDSEGNKYYFAFWLNCKGLINDSRTVKYRQQPKTALK